MTKPAFKTPDTMVIVFGIIVLAAVATWFVPPGAYQKTEIEVEGVGTREVVVDGTFALSEEPRSFPDRVLHSLGMILLAPILGLIDPDAAPVIAFVLLVGGAFAVLQATGAIDVGLKQLVARAERSRALRIAIIPLFMALFSLGGAVFGMAEETIPFVLIFVPLALALGYDSITGVAIPFVGSQTGFAAAFLNPFTVQVAQGIAEVPPEPGLPFRIGLWVLTTLIGIAFVAWHARRVKADPTKSPTYTLDETLRAATAPPAAGEAAPRLSGRQVGVLLVFLLGIALLVFGVLQFKWYINEIAALFVGLALAMGVVGGLGADGTAKAFQEGARDLVVTALIIGFARGILIVLQDAGVLDTILHGLASGIGDAGAVVAAGGMFALQTAINFFIPSGSGQAALTMPLMAPLADLVGVSRDTAVLAYQMGDGFTNLIVPTSAVLMGALTLGRVPWATWARWMLPLQVFLFALGLVVLAVAVAIGFGAGPVG